MKSCNGKHGTCPNLIDYNEKFCEECLPVEEKRHKAKVKRYDKDRGTAHARGYDVVWNRLRKMKLRMHPLCECPECQAGKKHTRGADTVHHIFPVETHPELRLTLSNLMSITRECHERLEGRKK